MSIPDNGSGRSSSVKTLAIRLEPDLHAQLSLIAQLRGSLITDEIRSALEVHLATARQAPELAAQASSVLDSIERDARARQAAISALFGTTPSPEADQPDEPRSTSRRGRSAAAAHEEATTP